MANSHRRCAAGAPPAAGWRHLWYWHRAAHPQTPLGGRSGPWCAAPDGGGGASDLARYRTLEQSVCRAAPRRGGHLPGRGRSAFEVGTPDGGGVTAGRSTGHWMGTAQTSTRRRAIRPCLCRRRCRLWHWRVGRLPAGALLDGRVAHNLVERAQTPNTAKLGDTAPPTETLVSGLGLFDGEFAVSGWELNVETCLDGEL